ncbi:putative T7SS-secreted protein [Nocardia caishijiensis]|uniref:RHS repeat-associated protein n=1 Tax=Nocardia caishijiensis TaxID=184756 RepID=A0ABQ6YTJ9_9NOCA|nr:DUF6531 domain-containing protein [Nocardia caishijiensis]KAF0848801.1 RHS repeat-associated protein [Nocardia caishijiensis]
MGIGDFINDLGDSIEEGLESATEKVGQAYNSALDTWSGAAKAVGADGLSEWLDDAGDKIVDATGGAVPEKELGDTTDPKELIRGEPTKIREVAEQLGQIGTAIDQTGDALRKIDVSDWSGEASTAFHEEFDKQPKLWWDGADAMAKAKGALDAWVHEVEAAQTKAAEAIAKWQAADTEERDRKNEWNAKSDQERDGKSLPDTWTAMRDEARSILNGARTQRDNAANTAVTAIDAATETAPEEPPFLSRWGSNFEDLGAALEHGQANITTGLLTSLTGLVQFVRSITPFDLYNATHPAEYMSKMSDMSTGMILATADPKATASAMLAGFKANPTEALGALTGDALTTLATGGAGGAAKLTTSAVNRVTDVADAGNTARNVLENAAGAGGRNAPEAPSAPAQSVANPADNPSAPATNPAGTSPDAPPTNPAAQAGDPAPTNPDGQSGAPAETNPAGQTGDAANPADNDAPNEQPAANPNNADEPPASQSKPDTDESSPNDTTPDGHDDTPPKQEGAPSPDADDPASVNNGGHDGDSSHPTEPGGQDNSNNNADPHVRSEVDTGGDGKPSVGEEADNGGPASNSTDEQTPKVGDPVNPATGEFLLPLTDLDLPGVLRLVLKRAHHSNYRFGRWFGPSWSATLDMRVVVEEHCVTVVFEDGMMLPYPHAEIGVGVEPITGGQRWKLTRTETGGYRLWDPDRELVWHFAPEPALNGIDTLLGNFAISAITDRHYNRIRFHYNSNGDPTEVTHSGGYRVLLSTGNGRVTTISVAGHTHGTETVTAVREFGYDSGELTTEINGIGGTTRFAYDEHHRMLSWTDSNGSWVVNTYDEAGRVITQRGADGVFNADYEYLELGDGTGRLTRLTDSRGAVTGYGFDNDLRLRDFHAADGGRRHIDYNIARKPLKVTEPDGAITRYEYTSDGDVAKIIRPDGTDITVEYAYANRPTAITQPDSTTVHREWDKAGNLVAITDAAGARTEYTHHPCGAVSEVRDPDGAVTRIDVDAAGLPVTITDPYGATTEIRRDTFGRPVEVTDPLGQKTHYEWTPSGRPARRTDPDGFAETWTYDGENNLLTHTDRNGGVTRYTYGGFDKVSTRTDPDGSTTRYLYNTERQLIAVINPLGQRWTYEYDLAGRLTAETDYTGATTTYTHTITGRVATVTPATGVTRHHRYDILGNLTSITADTGEFLSYTHDPAGRVLTAINGTDETVTHTLRFTYTPTGQVATQQLDDQPPLVNDYDHRGRRIRRTTPTGSVTTWRHNTLGQVTALHADDTEITFNHDPAGRLTGWRVGEVQIDRTFTPTGNIATQQVTGFPAQEFTLDFGDFGPSTANRPAPFTIRRDDYTYRPDGYLTHHTTTRPNETATHATYTLDPIGRVNTITRDNTLTEAYEYDPLSNITASLPTPDPSEPPAPQRMEGREYHNNLLTRDGRNHYYYDPAGRLIRKVTTRISRKPAIWHYRYNAFDQLTDVYTPDLLWWRYSYDANGRRVSKERVHRDGTELESRSFTWDGSNLAEELFRSEQVRWQYLPQSFIPITQQKSTNPSPAAIVSLPNGAPGALIECHSGSATSPRKDSLWGHSDWQTSCSIALRLPGQYFDSESGLHHSMHRIYDPGTGRFLTPDPVGLSPNSNNYTYPSNPTRWSDPLGLMPDSCTGTVWDSIKPTQPNYPGSELPRSFEMDADGTPVWVNGNATEHMAEYLRAIAERGATRADVDLATQGQLSSLRAAITEATRDGVPFDRMLTSGGWELKFGQPRFEGGLPVVFHALFKGG